VGTGSASARADPDGQQAMFAVFLGFMANGFTFASWASRIPQVRDRLDLTASELGVLLLSLSVGSMLALPLAGVVVTRLGSRRAVSAMALVSATGLVAIALGYQHGRALVALGLFALGLGNATWDVAMNVEGAAVEQRLGRSIMSRFHAGWSIGTVVAALVGAGLVTAHVSVTVHLLVVAFVVALVVPITARKFISAGPQPLRVDDAGKPLRHPFKAWTERRTLLIGLFVLTAAFSEGTGNDWLGVATIDGYGTSAAVGSLSFAVFLAAMTLGRWYAPYALDRWGRVPVLRAAGGVAIAGLMLLVIGPALPLALIGVALWGLGTALGFPVGMSAAADDPVHAAARVSVVASIGYTAFLAGPPLIGLLTDHVGILRALSVAAGLLAIGVLVATSTHEPPRTSPHPRAPYPPR
jgi:MFS family permease